MTRPSTRKNNVERRVNKLVIRLLATGASRSDVVNLLCGLGVSPRVASRCVYTYVRGEREQ